VIDCQGQPGATSCAGLARLLVTGVAALAGTLQYFPAVSANGLLRGGIKSVGGSVWPTAYAMIGVNKKVGTKPAVVRLGPYFTQNTPRWLYFATEHKTSFSYFDY